MSKCLEAAKIAYKNLLDEKDIDGMYESLSRQKEQGLDTGANLSQQLTKFAAEKVKNEEQVLIAKQLLDLRNGQALLDTIQRVKEFQKRGINDSVKRGIMAKIAGTQIKIFRGRESTELKMATARHKVILELAKKLDGHLITLWNSKKFELEIADALIKAHRGELDAIKDPNFKEIAKIVKEMQDRQLRGKREMGVYINPLDDRIAPNVHAQEKILKLTREERKALRGKTDAEIYDYKFNRWKDFIYPLLDKTKTFTKNNVDFRDEKTVDTFLRHAYDNITNKGKTTQERSNIANKMQEPRILHWADAESLVKYNERFGTGAIQDSIVRELSYGQARLEYMKDWGSSGTTTLDRALKVLEQDPELSRREGKGREYKKLKRLLNSLTQTDADYAGGWGELWRNIRAFESIVKLGMVTIRSVPDLGLLATEAARHGVPGYQAIGEGIRNFFFGMPKADQLGVKDLFDVAHQHLIGSIGKQDFEGYKGGSFLQNAMRLSFKMNLLERWDYTMRSTILSVVSRRMAQLKDMTWDNMGVDNQERLGRYGFDQHDWEVIRNANDNVVGSKRYITPDLIQDVPHDVLVNALRNKGARNFNDARVSEYRDNLESKLREYFQDRQEHVILRPGVLDTDMMTLGFGMPENDAYRQFVKLITQFKLYSIAYARVPLASVLYGKGATDFREATLGGKGDLVGMMKLTAYMMALKYASMTIDNLISGYTPPDLFAKDTWLKMLAEGAGIYGMALNIDPNDLQGSLTRSLTGAAVSDLNKAVKLIYDAGNDTFVNNNYHKSAKSLYNFGRGLVPKYPYSALVLNNLLLGEWEDYANPGAREKYLRQLRQKTGAEPIF